MAWQFYWMKLKYEKMDEHANDEINLALSQDNPPEEITINHWWGKGTRQKLTVYTINFVRMVQTSGDNGTIRRIGGYLKNDKKIAFDWQQWETGKRFQRERELARSQVQREEPSSVGGGTGSQPSATADEEVVGVVGTGSQPNGTVTWLGAPYVTTVPLPATICVPIPDATRIPLPAFGVPVPIPDAGRVRTTYYSDPQLVGVCSDVGSQPRQPARRDCHRSLVEEGNPPYAYRVYR